MDPLHITCEASLLSAGLRAVLPHVAKKSEKMPALVGVGLTMSSGQLTLAASDGATMATYRLPADGDAGTALWSAASAKEAMAWAKSQEDYLAIRGTRLVAGEQELEVELLDWQHPNIVGMVERFAARPALETGPAVVEVDPGLLGRFSRTDLSQHPDDKGHALLLKMTGRQSPVLVSYGDRFTGILAVA